MFNDEANERKFDCLDSARHLEDPTESSSENEVITLETFGIRGNYINYHVPSKTEESYCHCLKLLDCNCFNIDFNGFISLNEELKQDVQLIAQEVAIGRLLGEDVRKDYIKHIAVRLAFLTNEQFTNGDPQFYHNLNCIRANYGLKVTAINVAESPSEVFTNIFDIFKNAANRTYDSVKSLFQEIYLRISSIIGSFVGFVSEKVSNLITYLMSQVMNFLLTLFTGIKQIPKVIPATVVKFVAFVGVLFLVIILDIMRIMYFEALFPFVRRIVRYLNPENEVLIGEAPVDILASVVSVAGIIFGLSSNSLDSVCKRMRNLAGLIAGATAISGVAGTLFLCLPLCVRDVFAMVFSTQASRDKLEIEDWLCTVHAVITLSKIPRVLVSKEFDNWLNEQYKIGTSLRNRITDQGARALMTNCFIEIVRLKTILANMKDNDRRRPYPHSLHLCAEPGVSKSLLSNKFVRDVYGDVKVYQRSSGDQYWSGYNNHDFIVIDEFMCTSKESRIRSAEEYLSLISTAAFKPEMPSLNDPTTGVKGTEIRPTGVLTINNFRYTSAPDGMSSDALYRRREFVIQARINPKHADCFVDNKVVFDKFTTEQIAKVEWLIFDIYSNKPRSPDVPVQSDLTYEQLVVFTRDHFARFKETAERINLGLYSEDTVLLNPEEMLAETLREMRNIPNKPQNLQEALLNLVSNVKDAFNGFAFNGEGPETSPPLSETDNDEVGEKDFKTNYNGFKRFLKKFKKEKMSKEKWESLVAELSQRLTAEKLGPWYDQAQTLAEPFVTRCSRDDLESQKDFLADAIHANVDPKQIHRHLCTNCWEHFAHKHDEVGHKALCKKCDEAGYQERFNWAPWQTKFRAVPNLDFLLEDLDHYLDEESVRKELKQRFKDANFHPRSGESTFSNLYYEPLPERRAKHSSYIYMGAAAGIFLLLLAGRSFWKGEEIKDVSFGESAYRVKERRSQARKPNFVKGLVAEASKKELTIEVAGIEFKAIPVRGRTCMTYMHGAYFLLLNDKEQSMKFRFGASVATHSPAELDFKIERSLDLVFITLPINSRLNAFPNFVSKFWSEDDFASFSNSKAILELKDRTHHVHVSKSGPKVYTCDQTKVNIPFCLFYSIPSSKGDCGTPVVACGSAFPGKFMGMHVAGGDGIDGHFGIATVITRELLLEAMEGFTDEAQLQDVEFGAEGNFSSGLLRVVQIPHSQEVHLPDETSIKPSAIAEYLPWEPQKEPAILSRFDDRASRCPGVSVLEEMSEENIPMLNENILDAVTDETFSSYTNMKWPLPREKLSIEEAIGGVPGILASLKASTSAGYPLCKMSVKGGKKDWFNFDKDGKLCISENLIEMVKDREIEFKTGLIDHRYIMYLKDELVSQKKIAMQRTRAIFCGDLVANVVFRKWYGPFIAAFNCSHYTTMSAVGLNQYSTDLDLMYNQLTVVGNKFVAGDFKNFDRTMIKDFQIRAYEIIRRLNPHVPDYIHQALIETQMKSPIQFEHYLYYFSRSHFSGCFFTTIINTLVHEMYLRYAFERLIPELDWCTGEPMIFNEHVRAKVLGDDHIYCISDTAIQYVNAITLSEAFRDIGLTYTDASKGEVTRPYDEKFEDITFLGAHPIKINGAYVGALKKDTIHESLLWTKTNNVSLEQECTMMLEMAAPWGIEYWANFKEVLTNALHQCGSLKRFEMGYRETLNRVVNRSALKGKDFIAPFSGESPEMGLTKLNERYNLNSVPLNSSEFVSTLTSRSFNKEPIDVSFSTDSRLWRFDFKWDPTSIVGQTVFTSQVPFGLLGLGSQNNVQNMLFDRYVFWNGDVKVHFQINGQPFAQGLLAIYYMPLASYPSEVANITTTNHVFLAADTSTTATLEIPFIYPRNVLNTITSTSTAPESLGTIYVTPLSQLASVNNQSLTISVFTEFPKSAFRIPRLTEASVDSRAITYNNVMGVQTQQTIRRKEDIIFEGEGASQSTSVNNTYFNVGGSMPIQDNPTSIGATLEQDLGFEAKIDIPLDNPPLCSGSVPQHQTFSGMSASHGVRPTNDLQLFPAALSREHMQIFNPVETKIENLLSKKCLLTRFSVNTSTVSDTKLLTIQLNSRMSLAEGTNIPINVAILNQFMFWRGSIAFELVAVKTKFHSMRLSALIGYGFQTTEELTRSVAYSHIVDFSGENNKFDFLIDWNAQTEFLRSYEGEAVTDPVQNYSLGTMDLYLTNALVAPDSVSPNVEVLVFVRFMDALVAVPRGLSPFTFDPIQTVAVEQTALVLTSGVPTYTSATVISTLAFASGVISYTPTKPDVGTYQLSGLLRFSVTISNGARYTGTRGLISLTITDTDDIILIEDISYNNNVILQGMNVSLVNAVLDNQQITFRGEGPEVSPDLEDSTPVESEEIDLKHTTEDVIPKRVQFPSKLEIGRKFEFLVSDIHEVGRRYVRVSSTSAQTGSYQIEVASLVNTETTTYHNHGTTVPSVFRFLYAAWAGSIKYRVFNPTRNYSSISFLPTFERNSVVPIDVMIGSILTGGFGNAYSGNPEAPSIARERLYPISGTDFIDVSVPYQSHLNFLMTAAHDLFPTYSGTICFPAGDGSEVYCAFGDDLRLGVYRPPQQTRLSLIGFGGGFVGFNN